MIKSKFPGRAEPNTSHFQALLLIIARWMLAWLLKIILNFMVNEQVVVEVERHINNGHVIPGLLYSYGIKSYVSFVTTHYFF